ANHEALIENTKDGIWSVDRDMQLVTYNRRFKDSLRLLSGKEPELGINMNELLPTRYKEFFQQVFERALGGEQFRVETKLKFLETEHYLELSINPVKIADDLITGVSFFARNIDQRKNSEKRIQQSEDAYKL